MSTTFTFAAISDRFPVGMAVNAYPIAARPISNPDSPPTGQAVAISSVGFDGSLTFVDLAEGAHYVAYARVNGTDIYRGFSTDPPAGTITSAGPSGPAGAPGDAGPPGVPGSTVSDAVRGQTDRFYRDVGGALIFDGTGFVALSDSFSRGQNIDLVTTDSQKITVTHEDIAARALIGATASVGENLASVGIQAVARTAPDLRTTDILLRQTRSLNDGLTNPGDGNAWVKERAATSPFTASGLTNVSVDFATYVQGLANIAAHWRLSEASGATLDDAVGANDGAVVGSGATYGVTGGLLSDGADKAVTTTGISTNELTFPLAGITQAAYSLVLRLKMPFATKTPFRDATSVTNTGTFVSSDLAAPTEHIQYRMSGTTYVTTTPWSALADSAWHTLAITKVGANVALYLDGVLLHSASNATSTALSTPWHVGRNGTTTPYYVVTLSEIVAYSRALTAAEVLNIHHVAVADGLLYVSHDDIGSTRASEIKLTPQGSLRPVLVPASVTATGFAVKFLDGTDTQVTIADTDMALSVSRDVENVTVDPTTLSVPTFVVKTDDWDVGVEATAPILFARLGEASGTSFNDEIGTNDGASTATVTLGVAGAISGDANTAVALDGAQGKIAFANPALTSSFSISIWFKCTGAGSVGNTTAGTIIGWGSATRRITVNTATGLVSAETGGTALTTASGAAPLNVWNHLVYTWDGTTQRIVLNGLVAAEGVTGGITLNAAFYLGSYLVPSTNYSFKGSMDELAVWARALTLAEAQQLYVDGADVVLSVDRASSSRIALRAAFETYAPPPEEEPSYPPPADTPLPVADRGGAASSYESLAAYRTLLNGYMPFYGRALPALQVDRDAIALNGLSGLPLATSDNWRLHCCSMFGIDPTTGATVGATQGGSTPLYLNVTRHLIYVVPDTQSPRRAITDYDTTVSGWAAAFNAAAISLGGVPVPADAMPETTGDRYCLVLDPAESAWYSLYSLSPETADRAATTLELTSSPTSGGFFLEFDYMDNVNRAIQTFFAPAPIIYNDTAAQIRDKLFAAKTAAGSVLGSLRSNATPIVASGGPLNVAPVRLEWVLGAPLRSVGMRTTNTFLNAGTAAITYENAGPWSHSRLSHIVHPSLAGGQQPPGGPATATRIDQFPLIIDWDEYNTAYVNGTGLGHAIGMSIGNAGTGFVYPATQGDGTITNTDGSKVKQGALGTFPVTADFSRVDPVFMPIARTIQENGFFIYDKTGGGAEFVFRNWQWPGQTRPFPGPSAFSFSPSNYTSLMRGLPWHQLQIIDPAAVLAGW